MEANPLSGVMRCGLDDFTKTWRSRLCGKGADDFRRIIRVRVQWDRPGYCEGDLIGSGHELTCDGSVEFANIPARAYELEDNG